VIRLPLTHEAGPSRQPNKLPGVEEPRSRDARVLAMRRLVRRSQGWWLPQLESQVSGMHRTDYRIRSPRLAIFGEKLKRTREFGKFALQSRKKEWLWTPVQERFHRDPSEALKWGNLLGVSWAILGSAIVLWAAQNWY